MLLTNLKLLLNNLKRLRQAAKKQYTGNAWNNRKIEERAKINAHLDDAVLAFS